MSLVVYGCRPGPAINYSKISRGYLLLSRFFPGTDLTQISPFMSREYPCHVRSTYRWFWGTGPRRYFKGDGSTHRNFRFLLLTVDSSCLQLWLSSDMMKPFYYYWIYLHRLVNLTDLYGYTLSNKMKINQQITLSQNEGRSYFTSPY